MRSQFATRNSPVCHPRLPYLWHSSTSPSENRYVCHYFRQQFSIVSSLLNNLKEYNLTETLFSTFIKPPSAHLPTALSSMLWTTVIKTCTRNAYLIHCMNFIQLRLFWGTVLKTRQKNSNHYWKTSLLLVVVHSNHLSTVPPSNRAFVTPCTNQYHIVVKPNPYTIALLRAAYSFYLRKRNLLRKFATLSKRKKQNGEQQSLEKKRRKEKKTYRWLWNLLQLVAKPLRMLE